MKTIATIFFAYFFSLLGDSLFKIAFPLFVYAKTDSSIYTSFSYAIQYAPYILVMPFMGGIVDGISKKKLLLCTDVLSTLCMSMLALYSISIMVWNAPILPLFFFLFFVVSVDTVNHPAFHSFVPHIVSAENLPRLNSGMGVMSNALAIGGQLAGGVLILHIGAVSVFWMNALSFVLSFFFIALLPRDTMPQYAKKKVLQKKSSFLHDFKRSVHFTFTNSIGSFLTKFHFCFNFGHSLILGGMIYYLADMLNVSSAKVGFIMGFAGVGALVGSCVTPILMKKIKNGSLFIGVVFFEAFVVLSFVWSETAMHALLSLFFLNIGTGIIIVLTFTLRQQRIPKEHLGKIIVISRPVSFIPVPIASMIAGYVLGAYDTLVPLALAGFCVLFITSLVSIKTKFVRITNTR